MTYVDSATAEGQRPTVQFRQVPPPVVGDPTHFADDAPLVYGGETTTTSAFVVGACMAIGVVGLIVMAIVTGGAS